MSRLLTGLLCLLLAGWSFGADALESNQVTSTRATASLISDIDTVTPGKPFHIGLRLRLAPGGTPIGRTRAMPACSRAGPDAA